MSAKDGQLQMRIDAKLKADLTAEADRRFITLAALISLILVEWRRRNGDQPIDVSEIGGGKIAP